MVQTHAVGKSTLIYRSTNEIPTHNHNFALQPNQHENTSTSDSLKTVILRGQHSTAQQNNAAEGDECVPAIVISYCSHSDIIM